MGQKVNPIGLRLGINRTWDSRWFSRKEYGNQLLDDLKLRKFLGGRDNLPAASSLCRARRQSGAGSAHDRAAALREVQPGAGWAGAGVSAASGSRDRQRRWL